MSAMFAWGMLIAGLLIGLIVLLVARIREMERAHQAGLRFEAEEAGRRIREHIRATTRQVSEGPDIARDKLRERLAEMRKSPLHEALAADDSPKIWPPNDPPVWPEIEATRKDEG